MGFMICEIILVCICLYCFLKILSIIEKHYINDDIEVGLIYEKWSLKAFKFGRNVTIAIAASEYVMHDIVVEIKLKITCLIICMLGIYLRVIAIRTLGIYWSYHIEIRENHKVIKHGIYKYLKHPAYLGNIFIPALYASLGMVYSSFMSLFLVIIFYSYRSVYENKLLLNIEKSTYSKGGNNFEFS